MIKASVASDDKNPFHDCSNNSINVNNKPINVFEETLLLNFDKMARTTSSLCKYNIKPIHKK